MRRRTLLSAAGAARLLAAGPVHAAPAYDRPTLSPLKWAPRNRAALQALIDANGIGSPGYDAAHRPYAVFDWDNTSIMGDCEETLFRYAIDRLDFAYDPARFAQVLRYQVPPGQLGPDTRTIDGRPVRFSDLAADTEADYATLVARYGRPVPPDRLAALWTDPVFAGFRTRMLVIYAGLDSTHGYQLAYRWIVRMLVGRDEAALATLAHASNRWHLGQSIELLRFRTDPARPGRAGPLETTLFQCLRLTPEIADLQACLRASGIDVFVMSASLEPLVAVFATDPAYGYDLARESVFGVRVASSGGVLGLDDVPGWPMTCQPGKVAAIRTAIAGPRGYGPLCVFGDSDGDVDMLTDFPDTRLSLVVNRLLPGRIGAVSRQAASSLQAGNTRYLLQGRDERTGEWRPSEQTLGYDSDTERLLRA